MNMLRGRGRAVLAALALAACGISAASADWEPGDGHKMHYPQRPDPSGWDVFAEWGYGLADNWTCPESGYVTDIHFWGSWKGDVVGSTGSIMVRIHGNDDSGPFDKPGDKLWEHEFAPGDYTEALYMDCAPQGWLWPRTGCYEEDDHGRIYQYNIPVVPDPFYQVEGETYWLYLSMDWHECFWGWKTALPEDYYAPDAVFDTICDPQNGWEQLLDPITSESLDLAFVITPEPATLSLLCIGAAALLRRRRRCET
jgi:hypothetical protein